MIQSKVQAYTVRTVTRRRSWQRVSAVAVRAPDQTTNPFSAMFICLLLMGHIQNCAVVMNRDTFQCSPLHGKGQYIQEPKCPNTHEPLSYMVNGQQMLISQTCVKSCMLGWRQCSLRRSGASKRSANRVKENLWICSIEIPTCFVQLLLSRIPG